METSQDPPQRTQSATTAWAMMPRPLRLYRAPLGSSVGGVESVVFLGTVLMFEDGTRVLVRAS